MRLTWDFDADVTKLQLKRDDETGDKVATVTLAAAIDRDTAARVFGDGFARLVFDARAGGGPVACKQWKPAAVFEAHVVRFDKMDRAVQTIPEFDKVEPAGAEHVRVYLKIPFVVGMTVVKSLVESFGEGISLSIAPEQGDLEAVAAEHVQ